MAPPIFDMEKIRPIIILFSGLFSLIICNPGLCLDAQDMVRLQEGGIDGETIQVIIREKSIETCAFTAQEILDLKRAGMNNATIRKVVQSASFMKDTDPIEYGKQIRPVRFSSVEDLIKLKKAGISDEVIMAIVSGIERKEREDYDRAWQMLESMGLIIDERR